MKDEQLSLSIEELSKSYPGVRALDGVCLSVRPATVHALIGENGAGKSTVIKCLAGVVRPDSARVRIDGRQTTIHGAKDAARAGLAFIHQELNLIEYFSAAENVFLGREGVDRSPFLRRGALRVRSGEIFAQLGADIPLDLPVRYLSPGQRAMVAIGRAFAHEASVYFMDEPATALTPQEKRRLFAMIRRLTEQGKSVVYVTHNLDDVIDIAHDITVLREGHHVASWQGESRRQSES